MNAEPQRQRGLRRPSLGWERVDPSGVFSRSHFVAAEALLLFRAVALALAGVGFIARGVIRWEDGFFFVYYTYWTSLMVLLWFAVATGISAGYVARKRRRRRRREKLAAGSAEPAASPPPLPPAMASAAVVPAPSPPPGGPGTPLPLEFGVPLSLRATAAPLPVSAPAAAPLRSRGATLARRVLWVFFEIALTSALLVVIVVWIVFPIYGGIEGSGPSGVQRGGLSVFTEVIVHGLNGADMAIELWLDRVPLGRTHCLFVLLFALAYMVFAWIIWAATGRWVYEALEWGTGISVASYLGIGAAVVVAFFLLYFLSRGRDALAARRDRKKGRVQGDPPPGSAPL
eukprot:tig00020538_g10343.t1